MIHPFPGKQVVDVRLSVDRLEQLFSSFDPKWLVREKMLQSGFFLKKIVWSGFSLKKGLGSEKKVLISPAEDLLSCSSSPQADVSQVLLRVPLLLLPQGQEAAQVIVRLSNKCTYVRTCQVCQVSRRSNRLQER